MSILSGSDRLFWVTSDIPTAKNDKSDNISAIIMWTQIKHNSLRYYLNSTLQDNARSDDEIPLTHAEISSYIWERCNRWSLTLCIDSVQSWDFETYSVPSLSFSWGLTLLSLPADSLLEALPFPEVVYHWKPSSLGHSSWVPRILSDTHTHNEYVKQVWFCRRMEHLYRFFSTIRISLWSHCCPISLGI